MTTWLCCVVEKTPENYIVSCVVLVAKIMDRLSEMKHFLCVWITRLDNQKLAMSWIMLLLLHIVLSKIV